MEALLLMGISSIPSTASIRAGDLLGFEAVIGKP